jgi:hypothetical protein
MKATHSPCMLGDCVVNSGLEMKRKRLKTLRAHQHNNQLYYYSRPSLIQIPLLQNLANPAS